MIIKEEDSTTSYNDVIKMLKELPINGKNVWSNIVDIILIINNISTNNNNKDDKTNFLSELELVIVKIMEQDNLQITWLDILNDENNIHMKKRAQQFLNGYKVLINYIGLSIDKFASGVLLADNWITIIINTMLSIINDKTNCVIINSFCSLIAFDVLTRNAEIAILRYLIVSDNDITNFIISKVSDDWSFQAIELILRYTNSNTDNYARHRLDISSKNFDNLIKQLTMKVLEGYEPKVLLESVFLRKPYNKNVMKCIIDIFPLKYLPLMIHSIASLWGNKYFLSKGNNTMIEYLTQSLLLALDRIDKSILESNDRNPAISMSSSICNGISSYFESNDRDVRIKGMLVATKFSSIMGDPIVFEELQELSNNVEESKDSDDYASRTKADTVQVSDDNLSDSSNEFEDDDESDIEAYDLAEELDDPDLVVKSAYLRSCLDMLQLSSEAHDKHKSALVSIPSIVASNPVDLHDLSGPLTAELLRLTNIFNIENFENLRNNAILSLLVKSTAISIPVLTRSFTDGNHSIGDQLISMSLLIQSAYNIAEISSSSSKATTATTKSSEDISLLSLSLEPINDISNNVIPSSSKTTIKRAAKLAQSKRTIIYFQNKFLSVSHLFYEPLFQLLSTFDATIREKEITKTSIFQDTNIDKKLPSSIASSLSSSFIKDMVIDSKYANDDSNSLHYLIPSKALSALGQLVKCLHNTTIQRTYSLKIIQTSLLFVSSSSLDMRQSSMFAIYEAIKLLSLQSSSSSSSSSMNSSSITPLGILQNLSRYDHNPDTNDNDILTNPLIVNTIDWCVKTANNDPDTLCRALKYEIVKIAINNK